MRNKRKFSGQDNLNSGKKTKINKVNNRGFKNFIKIFKNATQEQFRLFARISHKNLASLSPQHQTIAPKHYKKWDLHDILMRMRNIDNVEVVQETISSWKDELNNSYKTESESEDGSESKSKFRSAEQENYLIRRARYIEPALAFLNKYENVLSNPPSLLDLQLDELTETESSSSEEEQEKKSNPKKVPVALQEMFPAIKITEQTFKTLACLSVYGVPRDVKSKDGAYNMRPFFYYSPSAWRESKVTKMMESITPHRLKNLFITDDGKAIREPLRQNAVRVLAKFKEYFLSRGFQASDFSLEYSSDDELSEDETSENTQDSSSLSSSSSSSSTHMAVISNPPETLAQMSSSYSSSVSPVIESSLTISLLSAALISPITTQPQLFATLANILKALPQTKAKPVDSTQPPTNKSTAPENKSRSPKTPPRAQPTSKATTSLKVTVSDCKVNLFSQRKPISQSATRPIHPDKLDKSVKAPSKTNKPMNSEWDIFKSRLNGNKKPEINTIKPAASLSSSSSSSSSR